MRINFIDFKDFYESFHGRVVQRILRQQIRAFWPETRGLRMLGLGYALPYLKPFMGEAERVAVLMPARQGAAFWPPGEKNLVALYEDSALPIETNSVNCILAIHAFQDFDELDALLRECWRVLTGQGRLLLVAPNRTGLWARADSTPFGYGTPWSMGQLRALLREHRFVPERMERALFVPPFSSRLLLATAPVWEKLGRRFFNAFGGVNIVEASKQVYAGIPARAAAVPEAVPKRRVRIAAPDPSLRAE
jgi:SAM-dependent methyltransferase